MHIPITFEFEGKIYDGYLIMISGGGSDSNFHLMIDNCYYGHLFYSAVGWRFGSNQNHFKGMDEYFGDYVSKYIASNKIV